MLRVLVDENLPRSLSLGLREAGVHALDVRDEGLTGKTDREVFEFAVAQTLTIITRDREFGNFLLFPLGSHSGVVIVRYPTTMKPAALSRAIVEALRSIPEAEILGNLVILEPTRIRFRPKGSQPSE